METATFLKACGLESQAYLLGVSREEGNIFDRDSIRTIFQYSLLTTGELGGQFARESLSKPRFHDLLSTSGPSQRPYRV